MGKMHAPGKFCFILCTSLALVMAACSTPVESSQQPEIAETASTPTPEPSKAPTPTVPPGWFDGMGIEESDYMYYSNLLLTTDDQLNRASITQDYGVSMVECATCDMVAGKFISVTLSAQNEEFTVSDFLFRFLSAGALNDAMAEISRQLTGNGLPPSEIPDGADLPAESMLFQSPLGSGLVIPFELFEIRILQEQPNSLSPDENTALLIEMAEIQLAKLKAAGY